METIGDAGFGYKGRIGADSLRPLLQRLLNEPTTVADYRQRAYQRASTVYTWESVTDAYEQLFYRVCGQPLPKRLQLV
ncbi:glycosyltransferase [Candidatus Gracilibacteria bacterium]|nr:glycosyltransferase [Candidatus Gracilibacteria bacterium]